MESVRQKTRAEYILEGCLTTGVRLHNNRTRLTIYSLGGARYIWHPPSQERNLGMLWIKWTLMLLELRRLKFVWCPWHSRSWLLENYNGTVRSIGTYMASTLIDKCVLYLAQVFSVTAEASRWSHSAARPSDGLGSRSGSRTRSDCLFLFAFAGLRTLSCSTFRGSCQLTAVSA